jgi:hypothetical protein
MAQQDRKEEELEQKLVARKTVADSMKDILGDKTVVAPPKLERELGVIKCDNQTLKTKVPRRHL